MRGDYLLLALVFGPFLGALAVPWLGRRSERLRDGWVVAVSALALLGAVALAVEALAAGRPSAGLPLLAGRLQFAADPLGALFALFSAFVWFCATLYSIPYMRAQQGRDRYHAVSLAVLGAMLGVVLAADLLTLFLFFETLGLAAFLLVVHSGKPEAHRAGIQYLWMTILGGVALLAGVMLVYAMGGGALLAGVPLGAGHRGAAATLLVLGFGVKAGMVPVHFWLPNAHPVAPSPASALLSGVMIKAGAYGIFRSLSALFTPAPGTDYAAAAWSFSAQFGLVVTWIGIVTMALGVVLALGQSNAKRMLAYHSISQMGFILAGFGAGAFLLGEGAMGTAGGLVHAVNHALFKAGLFLGVGAVAFRAGSVDMYALGGLWRRMPLTFALMLVAAAGITGLPLFNGFVSKSMIHHALVAAHAGSGLASLRVAEIIFLLTAAGTAASFIKLIGLVFLGRCKLARPEAVHEAPRAMLLAMALLAVPVIVLGWRPGLLLEGMVAPGLLAVGTPAEGVHHYLGHYFLGAGDIASAFGVFALGGVIFAVGMKFGLFHLHVPAWCRPAYWLARAGRAMAALCSRGSAATHAGHDRPGMRLLDAVRFVATRYRHLQQRMAWLLRALRRRVLLGLGEAGQLRRRLVQSVLVGLPGPPEQSFLDATWGALEHERLETVRAALARARRAQQASGPLDGRDHEARIGAARALAGLMAGAVFEARLAWLEALARNEGADAARAGFAVLHREFDASRSAVSAAAADLAMARSRGEEVSREVSWRLQPVLQREARAVAGATAAAPVAELPAPAPLRQSRRRREAFGAWLRDVARLAIAEVRQHPSSWPQSESVDTAPAVVSARSGIQRYARDVALNVVAIFLVMALLAAALCFGS